MMNRIKKALIVTLASISIIGNVTSAPVQARTFPDVAKKQATGDIFLPGKKLKNLIKVDTEEVML